VTKRTGNRILGALFVLMELECRKAPSLVWMTRRIPAKEFKTLSAVSAICHAF
jgi:hypothetical protein